MVIAFSTINLKKIELNQLKKLMKFFFELLNFFDLLIG